MNTRRLTRREILSRMGGAAAAVPLLAARAHAASDPAYPRRLVLFTVPSCGPRDLFWPKGSESDFVLSPLTASLQDLKSKLLFVGGIGSLTAYEQPNFAVHEAHNHLLTAAKMVRKGTANGAGAASIDWTLANTVAGIKATAFPQLVVGYNYEGNGYTRAAPKAPGDAAPEVTRRESPASLFDQIFTGRPLNGNAVDPALEKLRQERASVLDYLGKSLKSYTARLGSEDKHKVEFHLDAVRDLELSLSASPSATVGCAPGTKPNAGSFSNVNNVPTLVKQQLDVVATAMSCDLTRVVTLQWAHDGGNRWNYPWLGAEFNEVPPKELDPAGTGLINQHYLQHQSWSSPKLTAMRAKMEGWWVEQYAYLAKKLDSVKEGNGTMLDHTALVFIGAQGLPSDHNMYPHPIIIAGSCGGYFNSGSSGRFVRLGSRVDYNQPETTRVYPREGLVAHNRFLTSLVNAMGLDVPTVGMPGYGGALSELR